MTELTDIHSHILPGIDDGARTMDESIQVLEEAYRQQIRRIIVTPHFYPGRYMATAQDVLYLTQRLQQECCMRGIRITLYPGQECYYYSGLLDDLKAGRVLTLAGSGYVLVEFEPDCRFQFLCAGLRVLQNYGYSPILAHFERYECLDDPGNLFVLKDRGIRLQMNFDTLLKKNSLFHKLPWKNMVKKGMVDYLGSDCHGMDFRPLHVEEAYRWLQSKVDPDMVEQMLDRNVQKILKNG